MKNKKRITVLVSEELRRNLKIASAITGVSIKQYVDDAVREKMKRDNIPTWEERVKDEK